MHFREVVSRKLNECGFVGTMSEMRELDAEMQRVWEDDILIIFIAGKGP